jgi:hypothetical protein
MGLVSMVFSPATWSLGLERVTLGVGSYVAYFKERKNRDVSFLLRRMKRSLPTPRYIPKTAGSRHIVEVSVEVSGC